MGSIVRHLVAAFRRQVGYAGGTTTIGDGLAVRRHRVRGESVTDGAYIGAYHCALAERLGVRHVFTYGAARMACYALLKAMRLRDGDEIIMPGYNCVVIPNAIRFAGLTPIYVDIREDDFNIDPVLTERAITARTRAIVVQHTFGIPADMDALLDLCQRKGLPLIEDCAHALGATLDGRELGTIGYAGFYSTEATKMLSTEKGGILVTNDEELASRLRADYEQIPFRDAAFERMMARRFAYRCWTGQPWWNIPLTFVELADAILRIRRIGRMLYYDGDDYQRELRGERTDPYPCRLGNLMALAGLRQLWRMDDDLAHRRRLAALCEEILPSKGARVAEYDHARAQPSWVRFPFAVEDRERWQRALTSLGIAPGVWLNDPIHPAGSNSAFACYLRGSCPVAERVAQHIVNVPVHSRVMLSRVQRLRGLPVPGAAFR